MFRFTLREVVLVTAIVALSLGWWIDRTKLASRAASERDRAAVLQAVVDASGWNVSFKEQGNAVSQINISHK